MINVLIADDNIHFSINLTNYLNKHNSNIRIAYIAKNGKEAIEILNNANNIDAVLLDYKMPYYNGIEILQHIKNKSKYEKSIIIISGEITLLPQFYGEEMMFSFIHKSASTEKIISVINKLIDFKYLLKENQNVKERIIKEITYLGYDISYKGTQYLIKVIEYIALNPDKDLSKLEKSVYPILTQKCNDSIHNIKCNINRANNMMYAVCEVEKLKKYFGFCDDNKPKIKTVVYTILNKIS